MAIKGTHFQKLVGRRNWGTSFPAEPTNGEEFIDSANNRHCVYDSVIGGWWCAAMTTSTSTSTTSTSVSTSTTSTSSSVSTSSSTSISSSTSTSL